MPLRVLLVEDSAAMRSFVGSVLESDGNYVVDEVKDGFDALRMLPRTDYDLVITDINMPDINGLELIRTIRQHPRHTGTPLVVITTNDRERDVERALKLGATAVLTKPFSPGELLACIAATQAPRGPEAAGGAG
ncbi:MAG: response regulator [Myxococcales bacterium]|jgi:two-component system, chemotaxis family, chemotaxis protein CheY|nr:response regulator [Myxococcales bacterium]